MLEQIIKKVKEKMEGVVGQFREEIQKLRTSRASSASVENVQVEQYGSKMPLKQLASITTPQANLIQITPWDKNSLASIEVALRQVEVGGNPTNDGATVRITIPPMTGERREQLIKLLKQQSEEAKVILRQAREEALKEIQAKEKIGELSEDDFYRGKDILDKTIHEFNEKIDEAVKVKEGEIST